MQTTIANRFAMLKKDASKTSGALFPLQITLPTCNLRSFSALNVFSDGTHAGVRRLTASCHDGYIVKRVTICNLRIRGVFCFPSQHFRALLTHTHGTTVSLKTKPFVPEKLCNFIIKIIRRNCLFLARGFTR